MIDVLCPVTSPRLSRALEFALEAVPHRYVSTGEDLRNRRILFAVTTDELGMNPETLALLRRLRSCPEMLSGSVGSLVVDGASELYTKQVAQELVLAANTAGCLFPGKPLVEGTGSLYNQHILAAQWNLGWEETYRLRIRALAANLENFEAPKFPRPRLLVLHASEYGRSSTLWLWSRLKSQLDFCEIQEIQLQNGSIHDCRGCSYSACLHFSKNDSCFYGGSVSETVFPAIRESDVLLFLCPNYNDAIGANITALINRLTILLLHSTLYQKYL